MPRKYIVNLTEAKQKSLSKLTTTRKTAACKINHGRVLLLADLN
jgi:hypothetical protein